MASLVEARYYFSVSGRLEASGCAFDLETYAYPNDSRRNGISLLNDAEGILLECAFHATETRSTGSDADWAAAIHVASQARLTALQCFFTNEQGPGGHYTRHMIRSSTEDALILEYCGLTANYECLHFDALPLTVSVHHNA